MSKIFQTLHRKKRVSLLYNYHVSRGCYWEKYTEGKVILIKITGKITRLTQATVRIKRFYLNSFINKEFPYEVHRTPEENIGYFYGPMLHLEYDEENMDELAATPREICEFKIKDGMVISAKPLMTEGDLISEIAEEIPEEVDMDLIMTGKPKKLRDKLQTVLSTVTEIEKEIGVVKKTALVGALQNRYDLQPEEIQKLIGQLLREGTIYTVRKGYLKKT